jgi:hypothetical protein
MTLSQLSMCAPQVAQMRALAAAVADLSADHQHLRVEADGPLRLAQVRIRQAQVAEIRAFAAAVADLAAVIARTTCKGMGAARLASATASHPTTYQQSMRVVFLALSVPLHCSRGNSCGLTISVRAIPSGTACRVTVITLYWKPSGSSVVT